MKGINKKQYISKIFKPWKWIKGDDTKGLISDLAEIYNVTVENRKFIFNW